MVKVALWGSLKPLAGGASHIEVEADTLKSLLDAVGEAYPGLKPALDRGVSVSIDGRLYTTDWFQPIRPDSEVFLLPRIVGG